MTKKIDDEKSHTSVSKNMAGWTIHGSFPLFS